MKNKSLILAFCFCLSLSYLVPAYQDNNIQYSEVQLSAAEKDLVRESLKSLHEKYDPDIKMLTSRIAGYNYHTDATSGIFHQVRSSFTYAVLLLDVGDESLTQRAFDVIEQTLTLQDQDPQSKSCGVWPYYLEEPLATKKSPIDFNWADFNAVSLLDVWMGHQSRIPAHLKPKIKHALILAAKSIQKRNVGPGYTNIAIMGTYVTYMVAHLFDLPDMKEYARKRLQNFYDYTLDKGGFSEYNSPTYTIVALDELYRMKLHIVEPTAKKQIDSLYAIGWEIIARHYHPPTGQWAGPHSRSYSTLVKPSFYAILKEASNGKIDFATSEKRSDVKIRHQIPEHLMHYFLNPKYPRTEIDVFEKVNPQIIGTTYLTENFALSTVNRASLWNQRRPFLVYWGDRRLPKYLQVRFLHDDYDFSSAIFSSQQHENKVLAGIHFILNGGDKHISIDRLKDGKFKAKDLRLRFELGNSTLSDSLKLPSSTRDPLFLEFDTIHFNIQLLHAEFDGINGHWEKGGDGKTSWVDVVFHSGKELDFDLIKINRACVGFALTLTTSDRKPSAENAEPIETDGLIKMRWSGMTLDVPLKPQAVKNMAY